MAITISLNGVDDDVPLEKVFMMFANPLTALGFIAWSLHLSIHLSVHLSIHLSIRFSMQIAAGPGLAQRVAACGGSHGAVRPASATARSVSAVVGGLALLAWCPASVRVQADLATTRPTPVA